MKKTLYLIAGANGSGKTTLAHELLRDEPELVLLNADDEALKINDNFGIRAGRIILEKSDNMLAAGKSIALESTISGKYHERLIKKFREKRYEVIFIYVFLDFPEANIARVKKRVALGGHDIPEADIRRRFHKSIRNFRAAAKLADRWKLFYNGDDNYELIAEGNDVEEQIMNDDMYKRFNKGLKNG
ncbi:MAG: zeta toxin family protein [Rickettsiales bacterium]|jgi:predicted ABC-type ATPase|nr:zeta toxin family protein [Rickettsiales bacterium]